MSSQTKIFEFSMDSRMKSSIAMSALNDAGARRGAVTECIMHNDPASQFRNRNHVRALNKHSMVGSIGRVGAADANAATESFFALPPNNVLDRPTWTTRKEPRIAIVTRIERTYCRRRRPRHPRPNDPHPIRD